MSSISSNRLGLESTDRPCCEAPLGVAGSVGCAVVVELPTSMVKLFLMKSSNESLMGGVELETGNGGVGVGVWR